MGRKRKPEQQESFAEILDAVETPTGQPVGEPVEPPEPLRSGEYTDEYGVRWQKRGTGLPWRRVPQLVRDPEVRVLHISWDDIRDVGIDQREGFLATIRPYLKGGRLPESAGQTDFRAGEFKDSKHRSLLIVEEDC